MEVLIKGDFVLTPEGWTGKVIAIRTGEPQIAYVTNSQNIEHIFYADHLRLVDHGPGIPSMDDAEYHEILAGQEIMNDVSRSR